MRPRSGHARRRLPPPATSPIPAYPFRLLPAALGAPPVSTFRAPLLLRWQFSDPADRPRPRREFHPCRKAHAPLLFLTCLLERYFHSDLAGGIQPHLRIGDIDVRPKLALTSHPPRVHFTARHS